MSRIDFKNVCKRYAPQSPLTINNANLTIEKGEFCVFVGPSGCGKSTLLRMVAGLEDISSGDLSIGGERVNDLPPARRGVAMVFQSYALYPHMTVRDNMGFGLKVFGSNAAEIDKKVREAADILQLTPLLDRLPKELSGGQRQRVAIGRAIVKEPRVFLFDEPLSNLDAALRVQTRLEIAKLHREIGTASMIYVTHDQVEAMTLADKIVLLRAGPEVQTHGSIAQIGTPMDLYHRPNSLFVAEFIGSPKMNILPATFLSASPGMAHISVVGQVFEVAVQAEHLTAQQPVSLGLRPEHMRLASDDNSPNSLPAQVDHIEKLGEASLLYLRLDERLPTITLKLEGTTALKIGATIRLQVDACDLHLFDSSGQALTRTVSLPV
ncbi:MAG: sn-glycerol-3-phosphate ABC transporter ATP-binding protein UgpC [Hydrogenophaga sp.]|uniref:ABC transporter ATP-binding protein n=1 Tax=Hydrogenophaga sp. TaxID=1904254 RepID=UPI0027270D44|nr:sn-glycerol-3-phosphate ABC transporter ATP-binding protein UgpC [Hydrogenophaga sp.]MDO9570763.1 sn-glycerol-3-phosphate ABC transporter ATP-binding protein UgpC [Hydrogenophaga sp.]